jgi:hypothetical protein
MPDFLPLPLLLAGWRLGSWHTALALCTREGA